MLLSTKVQERGPISSPAPPKSPFFRDPNRVNISCVAIFIVSLLLWDSLLIVEVLVVQFVTQDSRFCATELIHFSLYVDLDISWNWGFHWSNVYFRGYPLTSRSSQIFISLPHEFLFLIFLFPASHFVVGDVRCARNLYCHWSLSSSGHLSRPLIKFSTPFHVHFLSNVKYFPNGPPAVNQTPVVDALRFPSLMSRVKKKKKKTRYLKQYVMKE